MRRPSVWLADSEIDLDSEIDPKSGKPFDRRFPCTYCGQALSSLGSLNDHMLVHTETKPVKPKLTPPVTQREKPFSCNKCRKCFITRLSLNKHLTKVHQNEATFRCDMCNRQFASKQALLVHWQGNICHFFNIDN
jgi:transcription elongation factor Elf1